MTGDAEDKNPLIVERMPCGGIRWYRPLSLQVGARLKSEEIMREMLKDPVTQSLRAAMRKG